MFKKKQNYNNKNRKDVACPTALYVCVSAPLPQL